MNKYEKALENIGMLDLDKESNGYENPKYLKDFYYGEYCALKELVDRATPKKPEEKKLIRKDNYRDGTNIPRYDWWCSNCHLEHMSTNEINYCSDCGQKILWEDE